MNVRNCMGCGRIFNYLGGAILCQACRERMESKFQEVKEYIRENPGVSIQEVSETCDVPTAQIQQWLREERLEVTENSAIYLNCESCGAPIRTGKFCEKCKFNVTMGFKGILDANKPKERPQPKGNSKDNPKMRYL